MRRPIEAIYWDCLDGNIQRIERPLLSWIVVRSYSEFVTMIQRNGIPCTISFDHDLHPEHYVEGSSGTQPRYEHYKEKTGYECLKWLISYCKQKGQPLPKCYIHTFNVQGRNNMFALIEKDKNDNISSDSRQA